VTPIVPGEPPLVVMRSLSRARAALPAYAALLGEEERAQAGRLRQSADRDRFVLGRGLARLLLAQAMGRRPRAIALTRDEHGKPRLADAQGLEFNIAHSGDLVAVAIGRDCELGIDVERHRPGLDTAAIGRLVFTEAEMAGPASRGAGAGIEPFFRQWVFKEALVKALGTGLARDPRRFEIRFDTGEPAAAFVGGGEDDIGGRWRLSALPVTPGYSAALAWRAASLTKTISESSATSFSVIHG